MKNFTKILAILLLGIIIFGCGNDKDDINTLNEENKFEINSTDYSTSNGYLLLDNGPTYTNGFAFAFLDEPMVEHNGNTVPVSTKHAVAIFVSLGQTPVSTEQDITNTIISNSTFTLDDDSLAITNISNFTNTYTLGNVQYGEIDDTNATVFDINMLANNSLNINSFSVDLAARTGTVDCNYSFIDLNGVTISGSYNGNFEIRDDH